MLANASDSGMFGFIGVIVGGVLTFSGTVFLESKKQSRELRREFLSTLKTYYSNTIGMYYAWKEKEKYETELNACTEDNMKTLLNARLLAADQRYASFYLDYCAAGAVLFRYGSVETKRILDRIDDTWNESVQPDDTGFQDRYHELLDELLENAQLAPEHIEDLNY